MEIDLKERIGIDRTILCDFNVVTIDIKKLESKLNDESYNHFIQIEFNGNSPIVLDDGSKIAKLKVQDRRFGYLEVSFGTSNLTKNKYIRSSLGIEVTGEFRNLQNMNCDEYRSRIYEVFQMLEQEYGIKAKHDDVRVKRLELNATFYIDEPYANYRKAILLMIRNVPAKMYQNCKDNNSVKYATWSQANVRTGADELETALVKNDSIELKIYNKGKHLKDIGEMEGTDRDIMRIEYTFKNQKVLDKAFGDNRVSSLTDAKVNALYRKFFNRDILNRYKKWRAENTQQLIDLVVKHRQLNKHWTSSFFRECREIEQTRVLPVLFSIEDMRLVFKALHKNSDVARDKFRRFKAQATYESDMFGNTKRIEEIFRKIDMM